MGLLNIIPHFQRPMRTFATCFFTSFLGTWFLGSMLMCRNDRFPAWNSWPLPLIVAVCGPILFLNQGDLSLFWKSFHIMCSQKLILQVHPILYTFPVFPCFFFNDFSSPPTRRLKPFRNPPKFGWNLPRFFLGSTHATRHSSDRLFTPSLGEIWRWNQCGMYISYRCPVGSEYPPRNLTWNLKMMVSKRNLLFQGLLFRFHVKFQGCKWLGSKWVISPTLINGVFGGVTAPLTKHWS